MYFTGQRSHNHRIHASHQEAKATSTAPCRFFIKGTDAKSVNNAIKWAHNNSIGVGRGLHLGVPTEAKDAALSAQSTEGATVSVFPESKDVFEAAREARGLVIVSDNGGSVLSVADAVRRAPGPVVIARAARPLPSPPRPRRIAFGCACSEPSRAAVRFALQSLVGPTDEVHMISVAKPAPAPIGEHGEPLEYLTDEEQLAEHRALSAASMDEAEATCRIFLDEAGAVGIGSDRLYFCPLPAAGVGSEVGSIMKDYCEGAGIDVLVLGCAAGTRGLLECVLHEIFGEGSIGLYAVRNITSCDVIIVKDAESFARGGGAAPAEGIYAV